MKLNPSMMTVIAACLLASAPAWTTHQPTVQAASNVKMEESQKNDYSQDVQNSLDKLLEAIPELKEYRLINKHYKEDSFRRYPAPIWILKFTNMPKTAEKEDYDAYSSVRLELDAHTGRLLFMDIRNPAWASANYPEEKLARDKAATFIEDLFGTEAKQLKAEQKLGRGKAGSGDGKGNKLEWAYTTIDYHSLINNLPLTSNSLSVSVDHAGHIISYEAYDFIDPSKVNWPDPKKAITLEEASKIYKDKLKMELVYVSDQPISYAQNGKPADKKPMLIYQLNTIGWIDALTGKVIGEEAELAGESVNVKGEGKSIKIASREQGEKWLKTQFGIDVSGATFEYDDHKDNLLEGVQTIESYRWMNDSNKGTPAFELVSLTTDEQSDQLIDFDLNFPDERKTEQKISVEEAKKKAIAALVPYLDQELTELSLIVETPEEDIPEWVDKNKLNKEEDKEYSFNFLGKRNGIEVSDESYMVGVDKATGTITELNLHPLNPGITLPDSKKIVSGAEAKDTIQQEIDLELVYVWEQYDGQRAPEPQLVYQRKWKNGYSFIDASTGELVKVSRQ
ncbi:MULTISPECIES: YcdB/YcdC domain-containing protein [Brevibacillus]|uniref:YcdB/YcdC domain-containing protein n=1 Tax=Brevibacillus TaxID=55080 RepID=UPI000D10A48F|nr:MULTISPECIES: YcdB/YcdC domain-containing protein [Brevibacillus]MED1943805.1 peptidase [Brevibacillus formosus]MED1999823.1 peptidase [Brevibacillus formosus]MED2082040.1 peptidase [Brevibacillus formosus]PSK19020.1 peptidase [Brevibacillus sp. NRRL NRS-603]